MGPSTAIISMQAALLGVEVFLVGLYVHRRFAVEDKIRAHCRAVKDWARKEAWDEAQAEFNEAAAYFDSSDPVGGGAEPLVRRLSLAVMGAYGAAYVVVCVLMLAGADPPATRGRVVGTPIQVPLPKIASLLLAVSTVLLGLAGIGMLRGRRKVIDQQLASAARILQGNVLDLASGGPARGAEGQQDGLAAQLPTCDA